MWYSPSSVRSFLADRLTPDRKAWFSRTRHGEQPWQKSAALRHRASTANGSSTRLRVYDARDEQIQALSAVRSALAGADIEFAELPRLSHFRPTLVVDAENTDAVVAALSDLPNEGGVETHGDDTWSVRFRNVRGARLSRRTARERPARLGSVTCLRRLRAGNGRELTTSALTITVELWKQVNENVPRADGACHLPGTLVRRQNDHSLTVDYIEPTAWYAAVTNDNRLRLPAPHLRVLSEPVDAVYT